MNDVFSFNTGNMGKYLVGFDKVFNNLDKMREEYTKVLPNYPPYNIVKNDEDHYTIEMAVAGFGKNNIDIELANNKLVIKGGLTTEDMAEDTVNPVTYLWKGISDRYFNRTFTLADTIEVKDAELINGMLRIFLENVIPDHKKPKKVSIK